MRQTPKPACRCRVWPPFERPLLTGDKDAGNRPEVANAPAPSTAGVFVGGARLPGSGSGAVASAGGERKHEAAGTPPPVVACST
eukprot:scaffold742_cov395-Prasinococcus_capsulatus_cf.AAC.1